MNASTPDVSKPTAPQKEPFSWAREAKQWAILILIVLGVHSFVRAVQVVEYSREGLAEIADQIVTFADAEDLPAHGAAVRARFGG